jgi:hypothetical protein
VLDRVLAMDRFSEKVIPTHRDSPDPQERTAGEFPARHTAAFEWA